MSKAALPAKYGDTLTDRELEVLRRLRYGQTNVLIANAMYLSEDTVKSHLRRVFRKLGVGSRVEAVVTGIETGVLPCPCRKAVAS